MTLDVSCGGSLYQPFAFHPSSTSRPLNALILSPVTG